MSDVSMVNGHDDDVVQGDLISRSALIEKCNETIEWLTGIIHRMNDAEGQMLATREKGAFMEALRELENAPAVDAVPVVRCEDCGCYMSESDKYVEHCCLTGLPVDAGDFCSYGKRREDDA